MLWRHLLPRYLFENGAHLLNKIDSFADDIFSSLWSVGVFVRAVNDVEGRLYHEENDIRFVTVFSLASGNVDLGWFGDMLSYRDLHLVHTGVNLCQ